LKSASTASYGTTKSNVGNTLHSDAMMSMRGECGHPEPCARLIHIGRQQGSTRMVPTRDDGVFHAGWRRPASNMRIEHAHHRRK
jgi:hypothetical protein